MKTSVYAVWALPTKTPLCLKQLHSSTYDAVCSSNLFSSSPWSTTFHSFRHPVPLHFTTHLQLGGAISMSSSQWNVIGNDMRAYKDWPAKPLAPFSFPFPRLRVACGGLWGPRGQKGHYSGKSLGPQMTAWSRALSPHSSPSLVFSQWDVEVVRATGLSWLILLSLQI